MHKQRHEKAPTNKVKRRSWITGIPAVWRALIFLIGVPSLYAGVVALLPRVSVVPSERLDRTNAFSTPFVIGNDGLFTMYSVNMPCKIDHMVERGNYFNGIIEDNLVDDISPNGHTTHFCPIVVRTPIREVIITVSVTFKQEFIRWTRTFHFKGYRGDDGVMRWSPYSPNKDWF